MKYNVGKELENQDYLIYFEPLESPLNYLCWEYYRPDLLAVKCCSSNLDIIMVECETKPNMNRVLQKTNKIQKYLSLQKKLNEKATIFPLIVIPPFNLNKIISTKVRKLWEIWIINDSGKILHKIPRNIVKN